MKALLVNTQAAIPHNAISLTESFPDPALPGPNTVRVKTLASALNHLDLWVAKGVPGLKLTYPRISGSDACGIVTDLGPNVDPQWLNKKVILNAAVPRTDPLAPNYGPQPFIPDYEMIGEHTFGTHAQFFNAPVQNLQSIPDNFDPIEAAAFGLTFLTAFSMMVTKANLRAGQTVLITGIGGGVASAALAIAESWSCTTIVTSRHQWKLDRAKQLGADHCILDLGEDWSKQVRAATNGRGVDLAVDSSGKATHLKCIKSLARNATYVTPGCTSGPDATTDLARIFWNQLKIVGSTMGSSDDFAQIVALYRDGSLKPIVDQVFPASNGQAAWEKLHHGEQFGKLVIDWR